jgi:Tol biopolymer transport system component
MLETGEWSTIPFSSTGGPTWTEWNTDGSAFYCACPGGISERAVSGDVERLVYRSTGTSFIQALEFSPDRKWLAFFHGTYGASTETSRILIANLETGETRTVLEEVFILTDPGRFQLEGWTPAGDLLVERLKFSATGNTTASEVLLVPVNGGAPRPIALPIISPSVPGEAPDFSAKWSPDGRSMVLGRVSRGSETFVIENPLAVTRATTASR